MSYIFYDFSSFIFITKSIAGLILFSILLQITIIDLISMRIPKVLCIKGFLTGILTNYLIFFIDTSKYFSYEFMEYLFSPMITLLLFDSFCKITKLLLNRDILGLGDSKLIAMGSAWVGWEGIWMSLSMAFLFSGVFSLFCFYKKIIKPKQAFPFAPFLSLGILGVWILGPNWWFN